MPRAAASRAGGGPPVDGEFPKDWILGLLSQLVVQLFHRVYHHHDAHHMPPRRLSPVSQFHPLAAAIVHAAMWASADAVASDPADELDNVVRTRYCDPAIAAISAWLVLVSVSCMPALAIIMLFLLHLVLPLLFSNLFN
jgi:hypothetical protein